MRRASYLFAALVLAVVAAIVIYRELKPKGPPLPGPAKPPVAVNNPGEEALKIVLDPKASYEDRVHAIKRLPKVLNAKQVELLRGLMKTKGVHPTIRNDVLAALETQPAKPTGLGKDLVEMFRDKFEDAVWRDYCLQHMAAVYEFAPDDALKDTLLEVAATKSDKSNLPGTALLSLQRMSKSHPEIAASLEALARKDVAAHADDPERAVTALQVARASGDKSVLDEARKIAADEKALVRLRMSAIGTLGELGGASDAALLTALAADKDSRIKNAAKAGLENLCKKKSP